MNRNFYVNEQLLKAINDFGQEHGIETRSAVLQAVFTSDNFGIIPRITPREAYAFTEALKAIANHPDTTPDRLNRLYCRIKSLPGMRMLTPLLDEIVNPNDSNAVRLEIEDCIVRTVPFRCFCAGGQSYSVRFAQWRSRYSPRLRKARLYLDCWVEEVVEDDSRYPEPIGLQHNTSLNPDRILRLEPLEGEWRENLDWLTLELWIPNIAGQIDRFEMGELTSEPKMRIDGMQVSQAISSFFWFWREWGNRPFKILSPSECSKLAIQRLEEAMKIQQG